MSRTFLILCLGMAVFLSLSSLAFAQEPAATPPGPPGAPGEPVLAPAGEGVPDAESGVSEATPGVPDDPERRPVAPRPGAGDAGIIVASLTGVDPESTGVENLEGGALDLAMWRNTGREYVIALMKRLPVATQSPAMHRLMRRLLLSPAVPPGGGERDDPLSYLRARLETLDAMGRAEDVQQLAALAGNVSVRDGDIFLTARRAALARGDYEDACRQPAFLAPSPAKGPDGDDALSNWLVRLDVICLLAAGERVEAGLMVDLARERGFSDPVFEQLVFLVVSGASVLAPEPERLTPLYASLFYLGQIPLPSIIVSRADVALLPWLMNTPLLEEEGRLTAGEQAVALGLADGDNLTALFMDAEFGAAERRRPEMAADSLSPPLVDALFYQTAQDTPNAVRRVEIMAAAFARARQRNALNAVVPAYGALLRALELPLAGAGLDPGASVTMASALARIGAEDRLQGWLNTLSGTGAGETRGLSLLPLVRDDGPWSQQERQTVTDALAGAFGSDDPVLAGRAARAAFVIDALGKDVGQPVWRLMTTRSDLPAPALTASLPVIRSLQEAASRKEQGLTVLLALIALGEGGPEQADGLVLAGVIDSLRAVELGEDARNIALESLLGVNAEF